MKAGLLALAAGLGALALLPFVAQTAAVTAMIIAIIGSAMTLIGMAYKGEEEQEESTISKVTRIMPAIDTDSIYYDREEFIGNEVYTQWANGLDDDDKDYLREALKNGLETKTIEEALEEDKTGLITMALIEVTNTPKA